MLHGGNLKTRILPAVGKLFCKVHQGVRGRGRADLGRHYPE